MKISTKFIGSSVIVIGLMIAILSGGTIFINQVQRSRDANREQASRTIEAALSLEAAIDEEIYLLKDLLLLEENNSELEEQKDEVLKYLNELEYLMPEAEEVAAIRRLHQSVVDLATQVRLPSKAEPDTYLTELKQYVRAINSSDREIDLYLDELIERVQQQSVLVQRQVSQLRHMEEVLTYVIAGLVLMVFVAQFFVIVLPIVRSLQKLQMGVAAIGTGNLTYRLKLQTGDEIEQVAQEFNYMAEKLDVSHQALVQRSTQLTQVNQSLESEISDRKQAEAELRKTLQELQQTQSQLIQAEKMSSLGQLVAGVAHEINNPVNFIHGNLTHTDEYTQNLLKLVSLYQQHYPQPVAEIQAEAEDIDLDFLAADLPKIITSMRVGSERIQQIVLSLRNFSRLDEAEMKAVDIHEGIDSTLLILQNRLKAKPDHPGIEIVKEYGNLPRVECYAGQLNQVFMNIINNAIDALQSHNSQRTSKAIDHNPNVITIQTQVLEANSVAVRISDNGSGIPKEAQQRLFDPFFTTKPVGKGTGLGLSISHQIVVEKHKGSLRCESQPGKGASFWIELPVRQSQKSTAKAFSR